MNNESTHDSGLQELIAAFETGLIEPIKALIREYRFYYDENGNITQLSDSNWNHPDSGNYVVVDEQTYKEWGKYRIRKGRAELKLTDPTSELQLEKSSSGYRVVKNNPAIILETHENIESTEYYDYRNR